MKCVCVNCGKEKYIDKHTLIKTHNVICECSKEVSRRKTRLYHLYHGIKQRCYNPKDKKYPLYGGKGIKMCDEWLNDYELFRIWALENGYNDSLTIDRIDSSKDYCPAKEIESITKKRMIANISSSLAFRIIAGFVEIIPSAWVTCLRKSTATSLLLNPVIRSR